ncbi:hypothetical protein HpMMM95_04380 [Helicobacter pylori]
MTPNQRLFLSGFFESRGSIDTQRNFLTSDYFFHSPLEFKKIHYLIDFFNILCKQIGNAVPPLLALALGKAILKSLRK